jgi:hypothetical protein
LPDQALLEELGYKEKLREVDKAILVNASFLNQIVANPEIFGHDDLTLNEDEGDAIKDDPVHHGEFACLVGRGECVLNLKRQSLAIRTLTHMINLVPIPIHPFRTQERNTNVINPPILIWIN